MTGKKQLRRDQALDHYLMNGYVPVNSNVDRGAHAILARFDEGGMSIVEIGMNGGTYSFYLDRATASQLLVMGVRAIAGKNADIALAPLRLLLAGATSQ